MNSKQRRNLKRSSVRMFKSLDLSGIAGMSIEWKPDQEQPGSMTWISWPDVNHHHRSP